METWRTGVATVTPAPVGRGGRRPLLSRRKVQRLPGDIQVESPMALGVVKGCGSCSLSSGTELSCVVWPGMACPNSLPLSLLTSKLELITAQCSKEASRRSHAWDTIGAEYPGPVGSSCHHCLQSIPTLPSVLGSQGHSALWSDLWQGGWPHCSYLLQPSPTSLVPASGVQAAQKTQLHILILIL